MYRPRVIPCLLLQGQGLVKTIRFSSPTYIGDPMHAVHLFNEYKADELLLLDINASIENRCISIDLVREIGEEVNMPFSVGGGITTLDQIQQLLEAGAERVILGSVAARNPAFVSEASNRFGKSSIAVCVDIKRSWLGKNTVVFCNGKQSVKANLIEYVKRMETNGAGELIIQSVDRDGTYQGLDQHVLSEISNELSIPITGIGGLSSLNEITSVHNTLKLNGYGAGSLFVFQGKNQGVLLNYPSCTELKGLF
ncbi:MAG: HisA/HisF-related TIM barrel protein [Flavobacteriia bacterium]